MTFDFLSTKKFLEVEIFALSEPPSWTRLEPQSSSGEPSPGVEARVHDPLWLLGRQWQLGEFEGEDAGTPLTVRVVTRTDLVDRWAAGDDGAVQIFSRTRQDLLEPLIEREPGGLAAPGLRARAEAGASLLHAMADAGLEAHQATLIAQCPLDLTAADPHAKLDQEWVRLVRLMTGGAMADAESFALQVDAAGGLPAWLLPANPAEGAALLEVITTWLDWYRSEVSPPAGGADSWVGERLEYRFRLGAGDAVFNAPAHGGGEIDWYSFDAVHAGGLDAPADAPPAPQPLRQVHALLASPLRYAGMPADRLWEMEDAQVNLGVIESEPWDLARLLVAEFALTYGNDWLVVPIDLPFGSFTRIESLMYTTTFGEHFVVRPTAAVSPDQRWRMFAVSAPDGSAGEGLLIPPTAVAVQSGPAIEEVLFLRDEMANMTWAIERSVQGPSGLARDRSRERDDPRPLAPGPVEQAQLDYLLQTGMPARWIPYLPRSSGYRAIDLVQGRMSRANGNPIDPLGRILQRDDVKLLNDEEIPREGLMVRRQPVMTRHADGTYAVWTTRRVNVGRGEGASQLAFDSALTRKRRPNEQ